MTAPPTLIAYGSLMSGLGLGGLAPLPVTDAFRVRLTGCRRGFGCRRRCRLGGAGGLGRPHGLGRRGRSWLLAQVDDRRGALDPDRRPVGVTLAQALQHA